MIQIKVARNRYESNGGKLGQLAMVEMSAGIEGMKKYSPPFGTTKLGSANVLSGLRGSRPVVSRGFPCPIIGSRPGASSFGFPGGKL